MQAIRIDNHGPISALHVSDVPRPRAGQSDVLVEIEAAAVNPSDAVSAEGRFPGSALPRILGRDFAGRVVDGPPDLIGKPVWGTGGDLGISRDGTHAEYIAIPREAVAIRPAVLSAEQAAAAALPYETAWVALVEKGRLQPGELVVVSGAAGAVGGAAVQIAAALGATIIALVKDRTEDGGVDRSKVAGIAHADAHDLPDVMRAAAGERKADLATDAVGAAIFPALLDSLADSGRMVVFSAIGGREVTVDLFTLYRQELSVIGLNTVLYDTVRGAKIMNELAPLFEDGSLAPPRIGATFPLSLAAQAYQEIARGKVVLIPDRLYGGQ